MRRNIRSITLRVAVESSLADSAARFSHGLDQATEGAIPAGLPGGTIHNETGGRVKGEGREEHSCVER